MASLRLWNCSESKKSPRHNLRWENSPFYNPVVPGSIWASSPVSPSPCSSCSRVGPLVALSNADSALDKANVDKQTLSSVLLATAWYTFAAKSVFPLVSFSTDSSLMAGDARPSKRKPGNRSDRRGVMVTATSVGKVKTFRVFINNFRTVHEQLLEC